MTVVGDGGLRWTSGRTCGGGDGDPTAEAHDTYKVSLVLKCSSRAGLVPVRNFRVARHTDGPSNRDERQELRRVDVLVFRKMARRAPPPSATLLSDAQHVVSPTSHLRKTVIRRTPATGPLEGTLDMSTGSRWASSRHARDCLGSCTGVGWSWVGSCVGRAGETAGASNQHATPPNTEPQVFNWKNSLKMTSS